MFRSALGVEWTNFQRPSRAKIPVGTSGKLLGISDLLVMSHLFIPNPSEMHQHFETFPGYLTDFKLELAPHFVRQNFVAFCADVRSFFSQKGNSKVLFELIHFTNKNVRDKPEKWETSFFCQSLKINHLQQT